MKNESVSNAPKIISLTLESRGRARVPPLAKRNVNTGDNRGIRSGILIIRSCVKETRCSREYPQYEPRNLLFDESVVCLETEREETRGERRRFCFPRGRSFYRFIGLTCVAIRMQAEIHGVFILRDLPPPPPPLLYFPRRLRDGRGRIEYH